jgi:FtsH-binding integral membrane protein
VSQSRTLWEEGHEPGRQVVALGLAVALTVVVLDLLLFDRVSLLFDICFALLCIGLALAVRASDFFTVGVLPPLLMVVVFAILGVARPDVIADPGDGVIQAVVAGLSHHSGALVVGYLLSLVTLAVRHRVLAQAAANRAGSPAPTRTTSG